MILAGTRSFGAAALAAIADDGHEVELVWAPHDDVLRRAATVQEFPTWSGPLTPEQAQETGADLIVCAHSHDFVSRSMRSSLPLGGVGYHPSLLPRHRGRDAVRWTIAMGDPVAGGSVYWLNDVVDGGPLAAQEHVFVKPGDDASSLWKRELFPLGLRLLCKVLRDLDNGVIVEVPQDGACMTWEPSWERPPLHRPDLVQIGAGPAGFETRVDRAAL